MKHDTEYGTGWTWKFGGVEIGIGWASGLWLPFRIPWAIRRRFPDKIIDRSPTLAIPLGRGRSFYVGREVA